MIKIACCDKCGHELQEDEIYFTCDGEHLCRIHFLEQELYFLEAEYKKKELWILTTWVKPQQKKKEQIDNLKSNIAMFKRAAENNA